MARIKRQTALEMSDISKRFVSTGFEQSGPDRDVILAATGEHSSPVRTVRGTDGNDFIHVKGDGLEPPQGCTDIQKIVNGKSNLIYPGGGDDIVHGSNGFDTIFVTPDEINLFHKVLDGGSGFDYLVIRGAGFVDLTHTDLSSVEGVWFSGGRSVSLLVDPSQLDQALRVSSQHGHAEVTLAEPGSVHLTDRADGDFVLIGSAGNDSMSIDTNTLERLSLLGKEGDDFLSLAVDPASYQGRDVFHLSGGAGDDTIIGAVVSLVLDGGSGNDILTADNEVRDHLSGGAGDDVLSGGHKGADFLTGGSGADRFVYDDVKASTPKHPDRIIDFSHAEGDRIDLSGIDADTTTDGHQSFNLISGGAFTGHAGDLIQFNSNGNTLLQADIDGDGSRDFSIMLKGGPELVAADIIGLAG